MLLIFLPRHDFRGHGSTVRVLSSAAQPCKMCNEICFLGGALCTSGTPARHELLNEPVAETLPRRAYFCARQKKQIHITYSKFQIEAEDYNLSGCFTNSGTKCFLFAKSLSRVQRRIRRSKRPAGSHRFLTRVCARTAALKIPKVTIRPFTLPQSGTR